MASGVTLNNCTSGCLVSSTLVAPYEYSRWEVVVISTVLFAVASAAVASNAIIVAAIITNSKFHTAGYSFLVSLSVVEAVALVARVYLAMSASLLQYYGVDISPGNQRVIGEISITASGAQSIHLLCIAVNRAASVLRYQSYQRLFSARRTAAVMLVCWAYVLLWCVTRWLDLWIMRYNPKLMAWTFDDTPHRPLLSQISIVIAFATVAILCYLYTRTIVRMRKLRANQITAAASNQNSGEKNPNSNREKKRMRDEMKLVVQFAIITLTYILTVIITSVFWFAIPEHPSEALLKSINVLYNVLWIINYSINPFVYITFNQPLRSSCKAMLACSSDSHHDASGSSTATAHSGTSRNQ